MLLFCGGFKPRSRLVAAGLVECALLCLESQVELPAAQVPADVHAGGDPPGRARRGIESGKGVIPVKLLNHEAAATIGAGCAAASTLG